MVEIGCDVLVVQQFGNFLGAAAVAYVYNGTAGHAAQYMQQFGSLVLCFANNISKVVPLEAHAEYILVTEMQTGLDILYHFGGCSGGQCQNGDIRQQFAYLCDFQIGGTEVIPPLRDAVAFVYRNHADVHFPQFGAEYFRIQTFGGDIEELIVAEYTVFKGDDDVLPAHAGVDGKCLDTPLLQILYLVFHQGYQGGNHQAHSFFGKCRDLESNGLAATRRHQSQGILILADAVDDIFLDTPKTVISPILL